MPYKIVTHDGKAHMDEVLGAALLALHLEEMPETLERIDAKDAEKIVSSDIVPDDTYFIDCGLVRDSERGLYDHHQDRALDSSALQIFDEFFPHLKDTDFHEFIKLVSRVDRKGAMSLDDFGQINESRDYFSFNHDVILRTFEDDPLLILKIISIRLKDKFAFEELRKEASCWLLEPGNIEVVRVGSLNVIQYLVKPSPDIVSPLKYEIKTLAEENEVSAILSFDPKREDARTLFRTDYGHYRIDFSRSEPGSPLFIHPGGFLMKFLPENNEEWKRLVLESILENEQEGSR